MKIERWQPTAMALNNPLIDEYSLKGAKGLLINITGGKDLTLFEVDQTVQKVRAEVDPEVELIFGAIKDESMNGKMRVSIVATALDGIRKEDSNTVLNMVSRIPDRNHNASENLFSNNIHVENNTFGSIDGATALKLDEKFEIDNQEEEKTILNNIANLNHNDQEDFNKDTIPQGVSIENASYMENNHEQTSSNEDENPNLNSEMTHTQEEHTPQLFSDETELDSEHNLEEFSETTSDKLFDQDVNEDDEDFEIPAFLRKQKF